MKQENIINLPQLKLPVGSDDFSKLALSDLFVDKSLFIKEVLSASDEAILITRPRRWGKTSNLQMLKYFLSVDIDENGSVDKANSSQILFAGGKLEQDGIEPKIFKKLKIADVNDGYYMRYQGQYPVIFINFRKVKAASYPEIVELLHKAIGNVFEQHKYLLNSSAMPSYTKANFERILNNTADIADLQDSLHFLSKLLYKHFNKRVYILIDEYDAAFNFLLEESLDNEEQHKLRKDIALLMTSILSACGKGNDALEKIILTGVFDTLKKEGNSGFNNIRVYGILDPKFSTNFGFSEQEISEQLLAKFDLNENLKREVSQNIKSWYNGYNVPLYNKQTYKNDSIQVYTPWAVINYLYDFSQGKLKPESYWSRSGASTILANLLQSGVKEDLRNKFNAFVQGQEVILDFDPGLSLVKYTLENYQYIEKVFSYLLVNSGYLTGVCGEDDRYRFSIPNFEVKKEFISCIEEQLQNWYEFAIHDPFVEGLIRADDDYVRNELNRYVQETFSNLDVPKGDRIFTAERSYHMFILGLLQKMVKTHIIKSEIDSGFGRADIIVLPRAIDQSISNDAEGTGFIIELKRMTDETKANRTLDSLAKEGMEQIKAQKYFTILDQHGVKNKVFISVAFYGKDVAILIDKELSKTFNANTEWNYAQGKMAKILW